MIKLLFALLAVLCGTLSLSAQKTLLERTYDAKTGTRIIVTALISQLPSSGYLPVRVNLRNGGKIDRSWSFRFTSTDTGWARNGNELRSNFSAACPAGQTRSYEFLVPQVTTFQQGFSATSDLSLTVTGTALPPLSEHMETDCDPKWPSIFMSSTLFRKNAGMLDPAAKDFLSSTSGGGGGSISFAGQFDPKQMSDQWLAYSGYDYCFLTDRDWRDLNPGARSALLQWNRLGGGLIICSPDRPLDLAALGITANDITDREALRSWGVIRLLPTPSSGEIDPDAAVSLVTKTIPDLRGDNRLESLRFNFSSVWPLHVAFGSKTAHIIFFILVLIAFGVLVGPINLFVFAKAGQRHRLFITTPIISVGASLLLVVLIIFQDGFGGRGQRLILMEVRPDSSENSAFLSQEQIARTGVLFGTGFTTSDPVYLSPVLLNESRWARATVSNSGGNSRYQAEVLENGLKVAGDWFQSRSEHGHLAETIRPTRGRIELLSSEPSPVITSTFEFPLDILFYLDPDGKIWTATEVTQGRKTILTPVPEKRFASWSQLELDRFSARNQARLKMTRNRKGHFMATSEEVPGIATLDSLTWKETHTVITGPVLIP